MAAGELKVIIPEFFFSVTKEDITVRNLSVFPEVGGGSGGRG
jgi:hypothetical protein